ncbi:MAG: T9SS type A sorting domain-containing protein, partial [Anaerolineales bacterium]|nr:T9SS type A sorting domain-containing protein [Anaerolineales bacterium]
FAKSELNINNIPKEDKRTLQFKFDVSADAEINSEGRVKLKITSKEGKSWYKVYNFTVTAPDIFEVQQNYPNPFNPNTTIKYSIPREAFVTIKIFNVLGEKITELVNTNLKAGLHEVVFDASKISSGIYFYLVEAKAIDGGNYFDTKKMILLK